MYKECPRRAEISTEQMTVCSDQLPSHSLLIYTSACHISHITSACHTTDQQQKHVITLHSLKAVEQYYTCKFFVHNEQHNIYSSLELPLLYAITEKVPTVMHCNLRPPDVPHCCLPIHIDISIHTVRNIGQNKKEGN